MKQYRIIEWSDGTIAFGEEDESWQEIEKRRRIISEKEYVDIISSRWNTIENIKRK